jgi:hypothetical protein
MAHVMRKWGQPEGHFNAFESLDNEFRDNLQYEAISVHKPTPPIIILLLFFLGFRDNNGFLKRPSGTDRGFRALGLGDHLQRSCGPQRMVRALNQGARLPVLSLSPAF